MTTKTIQKSIEDKKKGCDKYYTRGAYTFTCGSSTNKGKIQLCPDCKKKKENQSQEDEQARNRKVDGISNEMIDYALKSKSNKRDDSLPDIDENKEKDLNWEKEHFYAQQKGDYAKPTRCLNCMCKILLGHPKGWICKDCDMIIMGSDFYQGRNSSKKETAELYEKKIDNAFNKLKKLAPYMDYVDMNEKTYLEEINKIQEELKNG